MAANPQAGPELRRTLAVLLTERGKARAALGRAAEARADFDAAEGHNPNYLRLLVARAAEAYGRRDWATAQAYLDRAALQDEPLPTIAYGLGLLDYYRGQYAAAVAEFDRAIALSAATGGDAAVYHLARGYSYVELGRCDAAAADFRVARDEANAPAAVREAARGVACGSEGEQGSGGVGGIEDPLPNPLPGGEGIGGVGVGGRLAIGDQLPATSDPPPAADAGRLSPLEMAAAAVEPATTVATPLSCTPAPLLPCPATPTPGPLLLEIGPRGANVRRGPGAEFAVMATRRAGDRMEVLAANVSGEWYQVRVPGQGRGWVSAAYAMALGDVDQLGIRNYELGIEEGQASATPAADAAAASTTPRPGGSPAPGWTPPGQPTPTAPPPTAPAPPDLLPTRTPPASLPKPPTPTLLPPPTARAGN